MKTGIRFCLCIFFFSHGIAPVNAQRCKNNTKRDALPTYNIPSPPGRTKASALLAENNLGRLGTFSDCTIYIESGADFEIDVPLALFRVTVIAGEGAGIIIDRRQTLVITECKLTPLGDRNWNGIGLEDETSKLIMNNSEVSFALKGIQFM